MRVTKTVIGFFQLISMTNICFGQIDNFCPETRFESFLAQADSINLFMDKALKAKPEDKSGWERKFFCVFPNSYSSMDSLFGFNKKAGPLYHSDTPDTIQYFGNASSHIDFFSHLTFIPKERYYDKYVNICINGYWQADKIRVAFGFGLHLFKNPSASCAALSKRTDNEVKSVFRFIFDGPHPDHEWNRKFYAKLLPVVRSENERLSKLLQAAFEKLMSENHEH